MELNQYEEPIFSLDDDVRYIACSTLLTRYYETFFVLVFLGKVRDK